MFRAARRRIPITAGAWPRRRRPSLQVQGAVQAVLTSPSGRGPAPAGPRHPRAGWKCSSARHAGGRRTRCVPCAPGANCPGRSTHSQRPGPPRTVQVRRSRRPPLRSTVSQPSCTPVGLCEGRAHLGMQVGLVARDGQHVVGPGGPQVLHAGPLAAGSVDRNDGPLQHHALEQAGDGRVCVALDLAGLLGQGQSLPHQEGAHHRGRVPAARSPERRTTLPSRARIRSCRPGRQVPSSSSRVSFMAVSGSSRRTSRR